MEDIKNLAEFQATLDEMAQLFIQHVTKEMKIREWKYAYVDVRENLDKLRIHPTQGKSIGIHVPMGVRDKIVDLWEAKDKVLEKTFYGLKMTVTPDGKCTVEYNYDPNCMNDPIFFDD